MGRGLAAQGSKCKSHGDFGKREGCTSTPFDSLPPFKKLSWKVRLRRDDTSFHTDKNRYYTWSKPRGREGMKIMNFGDTL